MGFRHWIRRISVPQNTDIIVSTETLLNFQSADPGTDIYEMFEEKSEGTNQLEGCNPHCSCAAKKVPGKVMVQHDLSSYETPCVCSRLLDPGDSLTGWDNPPPADSCSCKQANGSKNKKTLPYSKLHQKESSDDFVFQHYRESKSYIEQYRLYHTKGTIKPETDATPVLGHDAPDPYLPKLRSIRARLHNDSFLESRSKSFSGFEKRNALQPIVHHDDNRRQTVNLSGQPHVASHDACCSNASNSTSSGGSDGQPRPNTTGRSSEDINLAPTREKLTGEKKQYSEVQSSYIDLQTPRASFPLPVRIVEDYCAISGNKAHRATSPKPFKSSNQHHSSTSSLSPRTSYSNSHLQETIALMQKFPENQTNVSNMILSAISDPAVCQHYLTKLKKVDHSQPGGLLVGSSVSRTEKPKRSGPPSHLPHPHKDKYVQVGLCELYSSGTGLFTGPVAHHQNAIERERPREVPTSPLSKLDVRGCQYRGSTTRKSLNGRPRRPVPSGSVRRAGSIDNE